MVLKFQGMRRLSLLICATLVGLCLVAPPAHAGIRIEHHADAVFVLPARHGAYPAVFVSALRMSGMDNTDPTIGSTNIGFVIQEGECFVPDDVESCVIGDRDRSVGGNFRDGDLFEFDDDLGYAHLKVRRKGITHEVTWRATAEPIATVSDTSCGFVPAGVAAGLKRDAEAAGSVLGRSLRGARLLTSSLSTVAFTC